jgi:hypothetical protein
MKKRLKVQGARRKVKRVPKIEKGLSAHGTRRTVKNKTPN